MINWYKFSKTKTPWRLMFKSLGGQIKRTKYFVMAFSERQAWFLLKKEYPNLIRDLQSYGELWLEIDSIEKERLEKEEENRKKEEEKRKIEEEEKYKNSWYYDFD
jgi:hypothetical protein